MKQLYSKFKVFHYGEKLDSLPKESSQILPPLHIRVKPTNVCTHNCSYCAYRASSLKLGEDMKLNDFIPRQKMMEIIDDIIDMGVKAVTFSGGGDPFCYPYLAEAAKKLAGSPVHFASLSNGALVRGEAADVFAHHATWLRISMDGWDGKSYAEFRGVSEEEFGKVLKNIENFRKIGGPCYLGLVIIVSKNNAGHIFELAERLKSTGANSVKISPCIISNVGSENNVYHEPIFAQVKEQIAKAKSNLASEDFEVVDSYHTQLESFEKPYEWCPYLQIRPVIGADLNVYSCQDKAYDLDEGLLGSIRERRFKDFWFDDKAKFFKINPSIVCNNHCVSHECNKLIQDYLNADEDHLPFV